VYTGFGRSLIMMLFLFILCFMLIRSTALDLGLRGDCHGSYGLLATPLLQRLTHN